MKDQAAASVTAIRPTGRRARVVGTLIAASLLVGCSAGGLAPSPTQPATPKPVPTATSVAVATPRATSPLPAASYLYDPTVDARAEVEAALAAAKADGKRVLIDYGGDWCPDCHSLAAVMDSPAGLALIDASYHVVRVDIGYWDHNLDVAADYGQAIANGVPAVVVVDGAGKVIGSTADGSLANARVMTAEDILAILSRWAG
jgi:thiol-disulfide isomerase/thioredoxin